MAGRDLLSAALDECGLDFNFADDGDSAEATSSSNTGDDSTNQAAIGSEDNHFYGADDRLMQLPARHAEIHSQSLPSVSGVHSSFLPTIKSGATNNVIRFGPHLLANPNGTANYRINLNSLTASRGQQIQFVPVKKPALSSPHVDAKSLSILQKRKSPTQEGDAKAKPEAIVKPVSHTDKKPEDVVDDMEAEDEFIQADTYADYRPTKLRVGIKHPDQVIETSSLSSVAPPDVWYTLSIPEYLIDEGRLSALQLESIVYAAQQHEEFLPNGDRAGFLVGDGAGVGKGRTIAGMIFENYLNGRKKSVWLSISSDLMYDARRDLRDIGAEDIQVYQLNKFAYGKKFIVKERDEDGRKGEEKVKKGVIFATYASLISESSSGSGTLHSRLGQLCTWLGKDFDGLIVFDECHKAKNIFPSGSGKSTKTAQYVIDLQNNLPKARIVYASATGASEPRNMGYMTRLGLWGEGTSFPEFQDFVNAVEKRGVGAMELIAVDLKLKGRYMARQLSFQGVNFRIERARMDHDFVKLYDKSVELWNEMRDKFEKALDLMDGDPQITKSIWTQFWASHQRFFKYLCISSKVRHTVRLSKEALRNDNCVVIGLQSTGEARTTEMLEEMGGELNDFLSTAKAVMQSLVERHFPAPNKRKVLQLLGRDMSLFDEIGLSLKRDSKGQIITVDNPNHKPSVSLPDSSSDDSDFESVSEEDDFDPDDEMDKTSSLLLGFKAGPKKRKKKRLRKRKGPRAKRVKSERAKINNKIKELNGNFMNERSGEICVEMKEELLAKIEKLGPKLPANTLDQLVDELGGADQVAEMTGRKGRIVSDEDGNVIYERRTENDVGMDLLNIIEKERFMKDEKRIAIISEAASSGISLHSDRRVENRRRRVHITIELPWSADRAIQQFGRTHRSNQVNAPEYVFLISDLAGEQRFASIVAKRLESLGALTHGDRRATESRDLSRFNIDNRYGREALETVMKSIVGLENPIVALPEYDGPFIEDVRDALVGVAMINLQGEDESLVLDKDYNNMNRFLNRLLGIQVDIQNALFRYFTDTMEAIINRAKRVGRYDQGIMDLSREFGKVELSNVEKFSLNAHSQSLSVQLHHVALERGLSWNDCELLYKNCSSVEEGFYATTVSNSPKKTIFLAVEDMNKDGKRIFRIYKPNTGLQSRTELVSSLRDKAESKISVDQAKQVWTDLYEFSANRCLHSYLFGRCSRLACDVGLRHRKYCVMSGSVLPVWALIEKLVPALANRLQIARLHTAAGLRVIGPLVPVNNVDLLKTAFKQLESAKPKPPEGKGDNL